MPGADRDQQGNGVMLLLWEMGSMKKHLHIHKFGRTAPFLLSIILRERDFCWKSLTISFLGCSFSKRVILKMAQNNMTKGSVPE